MTSYSQFGEDRWILEHLPLPTKGLFVEIGAYDGIASSNTYGFEREGWEGVCVEADPEIARLCAERRRSVENFIVGKGHGHRPFYINTRDRGMSGCAVRMYDQIREVPVLPLYAFLDGFTREVDLLSIDTEGTELEVWSTRGQHSPRIVIVEFWTQPNPPNPQPVIDRFTQDGYTEVHRTAANLIFCHV